MVVNAVGTALRDPVNLGLTRWRLTIWTDAVVESGIVFIYCLFFVRSQLYIFLTEHRRYILRVCCTGLGIPRRVLLANPGDFQPLLVSPEIVFLLIPQCEWVVPYCSVV